MDALNLVKSRWVCGATLVLSASASPNPLSVEPYLGQTPPGEKPEIFAPGLVSLPDAYEYGSVWSADGDEFYYAVNVDQRAEIRGMRWSEGAWQPEVVVVADSVHTFGDPFLSPDEELLYFISNRPLDHLRGPSKDFDIWFVERQGEGWGEPFNLGSPVNSEFDEYYISFSEEGRIYFASNSAAGKGSRNFDVYSAEATDSGFGMPLGRREYRRVRGGCLRRSR